MSRIIAQALALMGFALLSGLSQAQAQQRHSWGVPK